MRPLTKKYIFERRLDGKPIIVYVDESFAGWATKQDAKLLKKCGIVVPYEDDKSICTHEILTYTLPFNLHNGHVTRLEKGHVLGLR